MQNLQKEIYSLTKDFHNLLKCPPKAYTNPLKPPQGDKQNYGRSDNNRNNPKTASRKHTVPLLINSIVESKDWRSIEIYNLTELLSDGKPKKFFRLDVNYDNVKNSLRNGGFLQLKPDLLKSMKHHTVDKYILLQEESLKPLDYTGTMVGVARIVDDGGDDQHVRVLYLSLSRSNMDLSGVTMGEVRKIQGLLWNHTDLLKKKMVLPFISEVYPWCKNFSLPAMSTDHNNNDTVKGPSEEYKTTPTPTTTTSTTTHLSNGSIMECWSTTEYNNLEEITDWADSTYYFADINIGVLYESLAQDGSIEVDEDLYEDIESNKKTIYLIIRKLSVGDLDNRVKPVVGIARVLGRDIKCRLKCIFLALSCPQYVGSPWNDAEMFVNGQQIVYKEDVRIILDEYKLSLRHKKAIPLFDDLFPWCPTAAPDPSRTPLSPVKQPEPSRTPLSPVKPSAKLRFDIEQDEKDELVKDEPLLHSKQNRSCQPSSPKRTFSPPPCTENLQQKKSNSPRSNQKPHQKSVTSPRRPKNPPLWKNKLESLDLPSATMTSRNLPPLSNLLNHDKTLSTRPWNEIEAKNISNIIESKQVELFLCDTTIKQLLQSFSDDKLEISQKNMENIASSNRTKKYLVLRVVALQGPKHVVGIAFVRTSIGISKSNGDRFLVSVNYSSLSCPLLSNLTARSHYDGMDVYPNVANSFLQQYKFMLSKNEVKPLFVNVFPWNSKPPQKNSPKCNTSQGSTSSVHFIPLDEKEAAKDVFQEHDGKVGPSSSSEPILLDLKNFSSVSKRNTFSSCFDEEEPSSSAISFADIRKDLDVNSVHASPAFETYVQDKMGAVIKHPSANSFVRREEAQRDWSRNLFRGITSPVRKHRPSNGNMSSTNGFTTPPIGRGRGRGRLLEKQALR